MSAKPSSAPVDPGLDRRRVTIRWLTQVVVYVVIFAVSLLATSDRLGWLAARVYIGLFVESQVFNGVRFWGRGASESGDCWTVPT